MLSAASRAELSAAHLESVREKRRRLRALEDPGRKPGSVAGTYVTDIASVRQCVMLCTSCVHKFNPQPYGYVLDKNLKCQGKCDDCKTWQQGIKFFVHESRLGVSYRLKGDDQATERRERSLIESGLRRLRLVFRRG